MADIIFVAERLRTCWCIRPKGTLGTCGWINGKPWTIQYVKYPPKGMEIVK